jgi:ATP-dependent DNA helicase RecG
MFLKQRERFFPLPSYELKPEEVKVTIPGRVLDENYTRVLIERADLDLWEVILLDRLQKKVSLTKGQSQELREKGLVKGRYPAVFISAKVAGITKQKAQYIKNRGLDNKHYKELVIEYLRQYHTASREDLDTLLMEKLPDVLTSSQKKNRIHNLLGEMSRKKIIRNTGNRAVPQWELVESGL